MELFQYFDEYQKIKSLVLQNVKDSDKKNKYEALINSMEAGLKTQVAAATKAVAQVYLDMKKELLP